MRTLVLGASPKPERYAYKAAELLDSHGEEVVAVGAREGVIGRIPIQTGKPRIENIDTVTLYVGPQRQADLIEYVVGLKPRRVIFNPGTENPAFVQRLTEAGILAVEACTLVMLKTGQWEFAYPAPSVDGSAQST